MEVVMRNVVWVLAVCACGGSYGGAPSGGGGASAGATVIEWNLGAETTPVNTTVDAGTPVQWHNNNGGVVHSVTPDTNPPPDPVPTLNGDSFSATQTITAKGTYHYHCSFHPQMRGTLTVQ
jgi:plastocyanin